MQLFDPEEHPGTKEPLVRMNRRLLDMRDPRCCTPERYGAPCQVEHPDARVRACRHCRRPM